MPDSHCLNCATALAAKARFCDQCGQRADTARLTFGDVLRDLMHSFVNIERSPLGFAWALLVRPGVVAREFVEGKRRRYYGPFATLAVLVGVTALAINLSGYQALAHDGLTGAQADLLQRHINFVLLAQLPLLAVSSSVLFRAARLNLFEHMTLAAYALSVRAVFLALLVLVEYLSSAVAPRIEFVVAYWAIWYVYFGWTASQFYLGKRPVVWFKGIVAAMLAHAAVETILLAGSRAISS